MHFVPSYIHTYYVVVPIVHFFYNPPSPRLEFISSVSLPSVVLKGKRVQWSAGKTQLAGDTTRVAHTYQRNTRRCDRTRSIVSRDESKGRGVLAANKSVCVHRKGKLCNVVQHARVTEGSDEGG